MNYTNRTDCGTTSLETRLAQQGKSIDRQKVVQVINRFNFLGLSVRLVFADKMSGERHCIDAIPETCAETYLECELISRENKRRIAHAHAFQMVLVENRDKLIVIQSELKSLDRERLRIAIPDECIELNTRKVRRRPCLPLRVELEQNGNSFSGMLDDFTAVSFRVRLDLGQMSGQEAYLSSEIPVSATVSNPDETIYSGICNILRHASDKNALALVLSPAQFNIPVLPPKKFRCERVRLTPPPHIWFRHPFTGQGATLDVVELSGSGFSVSEPEDIAVLLPGMSIPRLELRFSNLAAIDCGARVIHRESSQVKDGFSSCGMLFTDMAMADHTKLVGCLQEARDRRTLVCNRADIDDMWEFFFDTGFIYPSKYAFFRQHKSPIKRSVEKLYRNYACISRHFIFRDKGAVMGHMALQRVYEKTWMMHHFAARKEARIAGPKVLNQIGSFINDSYCLPSNRMKYAIVYYRPDNKFPNQVFGGVARNVNDPSKCSLDTFAYFHVERTADTETVLDDPYELIEADRADLESLESFYDEVSGGLMIRAFDLEPGCGGYDELSEAYEACGFARKKYLFSLKKNGRPAAIFMVHVADIGMNFSDLTNCIHVFVTTPEIVSKEAVHAVLSRLSTYYDQQYVAVNLFPADFAEKQGMAFEKHYALWTMEMKYSDYYYSYLKRLSRFFKH